MENKSKKYLKNIIERYEKNTTDFLNNEEYKIVTYLLELIDDHKKLKTKYENTERELLSRTEKLRKELETRQKVIDYVENEL